MFRRVAAAEQIANATQDSEAALYPEPRLVPTWRGSPIGGTPQISMAAAATTIPVTNAATQVNSRRSFRNLDKAASPAPTLATHLSGVDLSRLYKIDHPRIFGAFTYWEEVEDAGEQEFEVLLWNSAPFRAGLPWSNESAKSRHCSANRKPGCFAPRPVLPNPKTVPLFGEVLHKCHMLGAVQGVVRDFPDPRPHPLPLKRPQTHPAPRHPMRK
jgi:hypothetical protein